MQRQKAQQWLVKLLKAGPQKSGKVKAFAEAAGISERTLERASKHIVDKERIPGDANQYLCAADAAGGLVGFGGSGGCHIHPDER